MRWAARCSAGSRCHSLVVVARWWVAMASWLSPRWAAIRARARSTTVGPKAGRAAGLRLVAVFDGEVGGAGGEVAGGGWVAAGCGGEGGFDQEDSGEREVGWRRVGCRRDSVYGDEGGCHRQVSPVEGAEGLGEGDGGDGGAAGVAGGGGHGAVGGEPGEVRFAEFDQYLGGEAVGP
nr:hypothetical protein [Micromonospora sp. DSM 115978]